MVAGFIQKVTYWDDQLFAWSFGKSRRKVWKYFFYFLSRTAESYSVATLGLLGALWAPALTPLVMAGFAAFSLELTFYYLLKKNIKRPRPFKRLPKVQFLIAPPDEFSFPSGHTAAAFLMAVLVSTAFPVVTIPVLIWASLVGFSRVYLGVHYPTDVLAGMGLGICCAKVALVLLNSWL